jgi:hypothetical protein
MIFGGKDTAVVWTSVIVHLSRLKPETLNMAPGISCGLQLILPNQHWLTCPPTGPTPIRGIVKGKARVGTRSI